MCDLHTAVFISNNYNRDKCYYIIYGWKNGDGLRCRCLCYSVNAVVKSLLACMFLKEVLRILRQLQQKPVLLIHVLECTLTNTFQPIIWIGLDILWKI